MRNNKSIIAIVIALVAVLTVSGIAFGGKIANMLKEKTMSPADYFYSVEKNGVKKSKDEYLKGYKQSYKLMEKEKLHANMELSAKAEDGLSNLISSSLSPEFASIKSVNLGMDYSLTPKTIDYALNTKINDTDFLSGSASIDSSDNKMYAQVPAISADYLDLSSTLGDDSLKTAMDSFANTFSIAKTLSPEKVDKLVTTYSDLMIESFKDVTKEDGSFSAGNFEEKAVVLTAKMDGKQFCDALDSIIDTAKKDDTLKEIVDNYSSLFAEYTNEDVDYDGAMDKAKEEVASIRTSIGDKKDFITMIVYVNDKGVIVGRDISIAGKEDKLNFKMLKATHNTDIGYELSLSIGDEQILKVEGNGKIKADKITADFDIELNVEDKTYTAKASLKDCNTINYLSGKASGTLVLESADLAPGYSAEIKFNTDLTKADFAVTIKDGSQTYGTVGIKYAMDDKISSNKPAADAKFIDANSEEAMAAYIGAFDFKKYFDEFAQKANLDISYSSLETFASSFMGGLGMTDDFSTDDFNTDDFNWDDYNTDDFSTDDYDSEDFNWDDFDLDTDSSDDASGL